MFDPAATRGEHRLAVLVLLVTLAYLAVNLWAAWPFTTDDAYITLRYARNLADGAGLVWNPGEPPVEGYSNFSYLLLAAAAIELGLAPAVILKAVGCLAAVVAAWLTWTLARLGSGPLVACFAPLYLTLLRGTPWWGVSGLETWFFVTLALGATVLLLRARMSVTGWALAGGLAAMAGASRPEGPIVGTVLLLYALLAMRTRSERSPRAAQVSAFAAAFLTPYLAYQAWRWSHYGRLLSNSAYCKLDADGGLELLGAYVAAGWPLALLALPLLGRRGRDLRWLPLALLPLLYGALIRGVVPVLGYHNRHVLLGLACLAPLAAIGLDRCVRLVAGSRRRQALRWSALVTAAVAVVAAQSTHPGSLRRSAERMADRNATRETIAEYLAANAGPGDLVATPDAGLVPFRLAQPVLDTMCLNCGAATQPPLVDHPAEYARYVLERRPRYIVAYVGRDGRFRSGLVLEIVRQTREFRRQYRRAAFFETATEDFHFALFERRADQPL